MATYEYNKELSFILPAGFKFLRETDDEDNEKVHISSGEYRDDEGEVKYKFNCVICLSEYEIEDDVDDKEKAVKELLDSAADCLENAKKIKLTGIPESYILSKAMPMSVWSQITKAINITTTCFCVNCITKCKTPKKCLNAFLRGEKSKIIIVAFCLIKLLMCGMGQRSPICSFYFRAARISILFKNFLAVIYNNFNRESLVCNCT